MPDETKTFKNTFSYKLIYIFAIADDAHADCVKIGDTTLDTDLTQDRLQPNCRELNQAALARIRQYTLTAGVTVDLRHTELAVRTIQNKDGSWKTESFRDHDVHKVLQNSGFKKKEFNGEKLGAEWFCCDDITAIKAITAVKHGDAAIDNLIPMEKFIPINFRPEQKDAIERTVKQFKKSSRMLWNAKMRFGKTLSALEVVRRMNFKKTVLITHRPVVDDGWHEDFGKIFTKEDKYRYGSKKSGIEIADLERTFEKEHKNYIYFASIQDLRGSKIVGGKFEKNDDVFNIEWDCVIIDEAHEGTTTELGDKVKSVLFKSERGTKLLELSGTPFNIMQNYEDDDNSVFTWDYVMEQRAKNEWEETHFGDSNPYSDLPEMKMYTYDLGKLLSGHSEWSDSGIEESYVDVEDKAFNFAEFFRVETGACASSASNNAEFATDAGSVVPSHPKFAHEKDVKAFLNLLTKKDDNSLYPFSRQEYIDLFHHTLWMVPGVKEALALQHLLEAHPVFSQFKIVNVAGDGDPDDPTGEALQAVRCAIKSAGDDGYTITLSCGKLTTGVSVKQWTAVFMLYGTYATKAAGYLQTIFRVQTPCSDYGKTKTTAYVFDFAPDRTLKMVSDAVSLSAKAGKTTLDAKAALGEFLNFCPVIGIDGSSMKNYEVGRLLQQLKRAYAERAVTKGFDDSSLYNDELLKLTSVELKQFEDLKAIIGETKANNKINDIDVNSQGLTEEEYKKIEGAKPQKENREVSPEENALREKLNAAKKQRQTAISVLRGISVRMPLLIYGADVPVEEDISLKRFVELVDDNSWQEFMPRGVTKEKFLEFTKYYDEDVFIAAGKRIRQMVLQADTLSVTERVKKISEVFSYFKNPDKETVLTPWRVVNMHISNCLGGYSFYDSDFTKPLAEGEEPHFVNVTDVTEKTLGSANAKILEINSKTGLYPLYCAYSIFRAKRNQSMKDEIALWNKTLDENIFVICKTPMAKAITKRTLCGFSKAKVNCHYFDDLVKALKEKSEQFIDKVTSESYWNKGNGKMEFDAIVGNPPYQEMAKGDANGSDPVYHLFIDAACKIAPRASLIHPARFLFNAGKTPKAWNKKMLNNEHFKVIEYWADSSGVFPAVDIKGGVAITYYDKEQNFGKIETFIPYDELRSILKKVVEFKDFKTFADLVYQRTLYRLTEKLYEENPWAEERPSNGHKFDMSSNVFDIFPEIFTNEKPESNDEFAQVHGLEKMKRALKWVKRKYLKVPDNFEFYKVLVPAANGSGAIGEILSTPLIGTPLIGHTETFLSVGKFETQQEAEACMKYIKTKFVRAMLGTLKITQHNTNETWLNVPLQDFTPSSDIDWTQSISELDQQLYKKYGLSKEEITFVESKVKGM